MKGGTFGMGERGVALPNSQLFTNDFTLNMWHVKVKEWMKNIWVRTYLSPDMVKWTFGFSAFLCWVRWKGWPLPKQPGVRKWFRSQQVTCEGYVERTRTLEDIFNSIDGSMSGLSAFLCRDGWIRVAPAKTPSPRCSQVILLPTGDMWRLNREWRTSVDMLKSIVEWLGWCLGLYALSVGLGERGWPLPKHPAVHRISQLTIFKYVKILQWIKNFWGFSICYIWDWAGRTPRMQQTTHSLWI